MDLVVFGFLRDGFEFGVGRYLLIVLHWLWFVCFVVLVCFGFNSLLNVKFGLDNLIYWWVLLDFDAFWLRLDCLLNIYVGYTVCWVLCVLWFLVVLLVVAILLCLWILCVCCFLGYLGMFNYSLVVLCCFNTLWFICLFY